jgi:hypothetical protein|tara:strand:- start:3637 stop:4161 length:525 start_codon:yes stop_codon:yes gene_type:complete
MFEASPEEPLQMYICFLPATQEIKDLHWLNKAAAYISGVDRPMIHTELLFAEHSDSKEIIGQSCSIHYDGEVFFEHKRFSRKEWHFRQCPWDINKAMSFCKAHVGDKFNKTGYFLQPVCKARLTSNRWFCSEIVAGALQAAGADVESSLHPHALYMSLKNITTPACPRSPGIMF